MNWKLVLTLLMVLVCSLAMTSCNGHAKEKAELECKLVEMQAALQQTEGERDTLKESVTRLKESLDEAESKLADVAQARDNLQQRVKELVKSADELQKQVNALIKARDELQRQVQELNMSRDAALAEAGNAQARINKLTTQLQKQVEEVTGLQDKVEMIRSAVEDLLTKLKELLGP